MILSTQHTSGDTPIGSERQFESGLDNIPRTRLEHTVVMKESFHLLHDEKPKHVLDVFPGPAGLMFEDVEALAENAAAWICP